jgi:hypothetical protein
MQFFFASGFEGRALSVQRLGLFLVRTEDEAQTAAIRRQSLPHPEEISVVF